MLLKKLSFIILLLLTLQDNISAHSCQQQAEDTLRSEISLKEVVIEAFNVRRQLLFTPGSLSIIELGDIETTPGLNITSSLNQSSGVFAHSGTFTTSRITIRGIGARIPYGTGKIRSYFNNIPITNGSGFSIIETIDPSVLSHIEIIKGPATSAYGAGLGGTVILNARSPAREENGISASLKTGSFGFFHSGVNINTKTGDYSLNLSVNHSQSNGFRENDDFRQNAVFLFMQPEVEMRSRFSLLLYYNDNKGFIPSSIDSLTFFNNPEAAAFNWLKTKGYNHTKAFLSGITYNYRINKNLLLDWSLFSTIHNENERRPFDFLYEDRINAGTRFKVSWSLPAAYNHFLFQAGGELFFENYYYRTFQNIDGEGQQGVIVSRNRELINMYNFFFQSDFSFENLIFSAGVNVNTNRVNYKDLTENLNNDKSDVYNYGYIISPRFSGNYSYLTNHVFFATISHGFSPPSISETLTPEGYINPGIKPEKSWNYEAGFRGRLINSIIFYDLSLYIMNVKDLLVAERIGADAWIGKNAGSSEHKGLEFEIDAKLLDVSPGNKSFWNPGKVYFNASLSLNDYRFTDYVDNNEDFSGNRIPGVPSIHFSAGVRGQFTGGIYAALKIFYAGRMPMNDENSRYTDSYFLPGIQAGFQGSSSRWNYDIYLAAHNLFNVHYASMILVNAPSFSGADPRYYYPGTPLNFSIGLKIKNYWNR